MRVNIGTAFFVAIATFSWRGVIWAGNKPIVAVFDVDGKGAGLSGKLCVSLSDYLAAKLTESGTYQVVPRAEMKSRLVDQKQGSYKSCYDQTCQIELGRELSAEKTLSAQVLKMGSRCTVTLTFYDLKRATTEAAATEHGKCGEDEIIETTDRVVAKLLGEKGAPAVTGGVAPPEQKPESDPTVTAGVKTSEQKPADAAGLTWVQSVPAKIEFTRSEVTVKQYRACVDAGRCTAPKPKSEAKYCKNWDDMERDQHPANCTNWFQATDFCEWAGGRLPTEDEWYAEASDGGKRQYPWGDGPESCEYAIWGERQWGCGMGSTWPVCSKPKGNSVSGLCDMSGNVWEWTASKEWSARVLRGGCFTSKGPGTLRASSRTKNNPKIGTSGWGFRCVR